MNKNVQYALIFGVLIIALSVAYYVFIFQPQLAVNSCLVKTRKDFDTSKANTCNELLEINKILYKRCIDNTSNPSNCIILNSDVFSPSLSCKIPDNLMRTLQQDYNDAAQRCKNLSIVKIQ
jgi:hypothetical protein